MNAVVRWSYGIKCSPDFSTSLSRGVFFFFFLRDSEMVMSDLAWRQNGIMSVSVKSARICFRRNCWHTGNNLTPGISESRHCLGGKDGGWGDDVIHCILTACCVIARFMHSSSSCLFPLAKFLVCFIRDDSLRHVLGLKGGYKNCSLIYDLYVIRMKRGWFGYSLWSSCYFDLHFMEVIKRGPMKINQIVKCVCARAC